MAVSQPTRTRGEPRQRLDRDRAPVIRIPSVPEEKRRGRALTTRSTSGGRCPGFLRGDMLARRIRAAPAPANSALESRETPLGVLADVTLLVGSHRERAARSGYNPPRRRRRARHFQLSRLTHAVHGGSALAVRPRALPLD